MGWNVSGVVSVVLADSVVEVEFEVEDVLVDAGVDVPEGRSMAARRAVDDLVIGLASAPPPAAAAAPSSSVLSFSSSSSSRPLGYSVQEALTWERVIGVRFSRVALSTSKQ